MTAALHLIPNGWTPEAAIIGRCIESHVQNALLSAKDGSLYTAGSAIAQATSLSFALSDRGDATRAKALIDNARTACEARDLEACRLLERSGR